MSDQTRNSLQGQGLFKKGDIVWIHFKKREYPARINVYYPKEKKVSYVWFPLNRKSIKSVFKANEANIRPFTLEDPLPQNADAIMQQSYDEARRILEGTSEEDILNESEQFINEFEAEKASHKKKLSDVVKKGKTPKKSNLAQIEQPSTPSYNKGDPIIVDSDIGMWPGIFHSPSPANPLKIQYSLFPRNAASNEQIIESSPKIYPLPIEHVDEAIHQKQGSEALLNALEDARQYIVERTATGSGSWKKHSATGSSSSVTVVPETPQPSHKATNRTAKKVSKEVKEAFEKKKEQNQPAKKEEVKLDQQSSFALPPPMELPIAKAKTPTPVPSQLKRGRKRSYKTQQLEELHQLENKMDKEDTLLQEGQQPEEKGREPTTKKLRKEENKATIGNEKMPVEEIEKEVDEKVLAEGNETASEDEKVLAEGNATAVGDEKVPDLKNETAVKDVPMPAISKEISPQPLSSIKEGQQKATNGHLSRLEKHQMVEQAKKDRATTSMDKEKLVAMAQTKSQSEDIQQQKAKSPKKILELALSEEAHQHLEEIWKGFGADWPKEFNNDSFGSGIMLDFRSGELLTSYETEQLINQVHSWIKQSPLTPKFSYFRGFYFISKYVLPELCAFALSKQQGISLAEAKQTFAERNIGGKTHSNQPQSMSLDTLVLAVNLTEKQNGTERAVSS